MPQLPGTIESAPSSVAPVIPLRETTPIRPAPMLPGADTNVYEEAQGLWSLPAPTSEVLGATAEEAFTLNPTPSIIRGFSRAETDRSSAAERRDRVSPLDSDFELPEAPVQLSPEEANKRFGVDWYGERVLKWDSPVSEPIASELRDLKIKELSRQTTLSRAQGGAGQSTARFLTGLATSVIDPLNIASAFIPVVGEARYAALLLGASGAAGRAGVRAGIGAVEGAAGAALVEPIVYGVAQSEQADYGLADSFLNIVFGTALGGGLHMSFGAVGDRLGTSTYAREIEAQGARSGPIEIMPEVGGRSIPEATSRIADDINALSPEARETLLRASVAEMVQNGELRATGAIAEGLGVGAALRGEPGWRFTEADLEALRLEQPELVARSDEALARLQEANRTVETLQQQIEGISTADVVSRMDEVTGERIRAIDDELGGTIPSARRAALEAERGSIVESLGTDRIDRAANDMLIGPRKQLRQAVSTAARARAEARRTGREIDAALGDAIAPEPTVRAMAEAVEPERVEPPVKVEDATPEAAARELRDMEARLAALDAIDPLSPEARLSLDEADMLISQANNEARALDIALACAMRG